MAINNADEHECRYCLMAEPVSDLIRPCSCTGTVRYAHRGCLNRWRALSPHSDAMTTCEICHTQFQIVNTKITEEPSCASRAKFVFFVVLRIANKFYASNSQRASNSPKIRQRLWHHIPSIFRDGQ